MVRVQELQLYQFRCFSQLQLTLDAPVVLITGANGIGKTTILEALVYTSGARSFRNSVPRELIQHDKSACAIRACYVAPDVVPSQIHVALTSTRRVIRVNGRSVTTNRDEWRVARVISVTEQDCAVVQGSPENRRNFLDQGIAASEYSYYETMRTYKRTLEQRNRLLAQEYFDEDAFVVWTQGLLGLGNVIRQRRVSFLKHIIEHINALLAALPHGLPPVRMAYVPHHISGETVHELLKKNSNLSVRERGAQRTLFGAHLDDLSFELEGYGARTFASRGQQRLLAIVLKVAVARFLLNESQRVILVLDDVMTDFDKQRLDQLMQVLSGLNCQLIMSSAYPSGVLMNALGNSCLFVDLDAINANQSTHQAQWLCTSTFFKNKRLRS